MQRCTGVTKRGLTCTRTVVFPQTRCKTHRIPTGNSSTNTSTNSSSHDMIPSSPTRESDAQETTDARVVAQTTVSMYEELLKYHLMNPNPFDGAVGDGEMIDEHRDNDFSGDSYDAVYDGRWIRQQQDDEYEMALRKDRAIARWKRCRILVYTLTELCRWRRSHLCSSVIRLIQRYETQGRSICFSECASQNDRVRIGDIIQKNKQIERWCKLWIEHKRHCDWDASKMMDVQLNTMHILID